MKVKAKWLLGHPQFKGETDVTVEIKNNQAYYNGELLTLSKQGVKALRADMKGVK